ncbi:MULTISPECIES: hypothetical protein [unclassified Anabaena]|uniref:hypothetical protein n=1 Tax=unclassified Anabaena TaxID=2619674 RepID=UPI00082F0217|nr:MULTISPECIES: hypothetical protein [unclassified Anabaena]
MRSKFVLASTTLACLTLLVSNGQIARGDNQHNHHSEHDHKTIEIPPGQPIPKVDLVVHKDSSKGWNLEAKVSNFRFAPEKINQAAKPGEGHGHIYINGQKITRLYGSWYYLEKLQPGKNEITVSLNANSHEALVHNGKVIQDTAIIDVPRD